MSNLTPELRPDKNGKLVTRHVKPEAQITGAKKLPAPAITASSAKSTFIRDDVFYEALNLWKPDEVDGYFAFISRKPEIVQESLAEALIKAKTKDEVDVTFSVFESWSTNPSLMRLALDDLNFVVTLSHRVDSTDKWGQALSIMEGAFRENFKKDSLNPETLDIAAYGPYLRAATIVRGLSMDNSVPTSMDEYLQRQHVMENLDVFTRNYTVIDKALAHINDPYQKLLDSHEFLEICNLLDEDPDAGTVLLSYVADRQHIDIDEFREVLAGPSRSLSGGIL